MTEFAVLAPRNAATALPDDVAAALRAGAFTPAGLITCPEGKTPRWRTEAKRGHLYVSFETGAVFGGTSQTVTDLGSVFAMLGNDTFVSLEGRYGKSPIRIHPGEPERLAGVVLEALGRSYDPASLGQGLNLSLTTHETIRLVIIALGEAHRSPLGLDAVWRDVRVLGIRRPDDAMSREADLVRTYQSAHRTLSESTAAIEAHFTPLVDAAIRDGDAVRVYHLAQRCPTPSVRASFLDRARAAGLPQPVHT